LSWIDDPTNDDETYERPRIRRKLNDFDQTGIDFDQLERYALVMGRWRAKIAQKMAFWLLCSIEVNPSNGHLLVKIDRDEAPIHRIQVELVRELVRFIGGDCYLVSEVMAQKAARSLWPSNDEKTLDMPKAFSIGRCVFRPKNTSKWGDDISYWELARAQRHLPQAIFDPVSNPTGRVERCIKWDGRFDITSSAKSPQKTEFEINGTTPMPLPNGDALTILFRPAVLDGPINEHDWLIFEIFEKKLAGN
ncbi:MAG: hypothetical protein JKY99_10685, partial [Rhizobiales bacterium]|nr:hypothetical protein [Hyphomicrobiales bacterium]